MYGKIKFNQKILDEISVWISVHAGVVGQK
jgi:hypothetical protein